MKSTIFIIRGGFANQYELQNYEPLESKFNLKVITSKKTLTPIHLPTISLYSPQDLPNFPFKQAILNRFLGDSHWLFGLDNLVHQYKPSILHVAETYFAYTHQALQLKKQGLVKTIISTCWETIPHNNETLTRKRQWKHEAIKLIDHFIVPTFKAKQALVKEGVKSQRISLIRVGVDLDKFHPNSKPKRTKTLTITYLGRRVAEKGIDDLIQATHQLAHLNFKLQLIHHLPYNQTPEAYRQTDIFVLPSRQTETWEEQYGMVLVEAMASGLPIITTQTGAIPEVVGDSALLVPDKSPQQLALALETLLTNPALRLKLARKARARAEKYFDRQLIAKQLEKLYNRFI